MSVHVEIERALISRVENEQTFSPRLRVVGPLQSFERESGETYLRTSFFPNLTETVAVAKGGPILYTGTFQVLVIGPATGSSFELKAIAGEVAEQLFSQGTTVLTESGGKIKIAREASIAPLISDPVSPSIPVSVPYSMVRVK